MNFAKSLPNKWVWAAISISSFTGSLIPASAISRSNANKIKSLSINTLIASRRSLASLLNSSLVNNCSTTYCNESGVLVCTKSYATTNNSPTSSAAISGLTYSINSSAISLA
mgnify:CR=1 FL=1